MFYFSLSPKSAKMMIKDVLQDLNPQRQTLQEKRTVGKRFQLIFWKPKVDGIGVAAKVIDGVQLSACKGHRGDDYSPSSPQKPQGCSSWGSQGHIKDEQGPDKEEPERAIPANPTAASAYPHAVRLGPEVCYLKTLQTTELKGTGEHAQMEPQKPQPARSLSGPPHLHPSPFHKTQASEDSEQPYRKCLWALKIQGPREKHFPPLNHPVFPCRCWWITA